MTIRKLKFSAIILAMLFTAGCASTSNQQHTSAPSQHWAVLADPVADDVFEIPYQNSLKTLYFAFNSAAIRATGEQKLNELLMQISNDSRIMITGHACAIGTRTFNQDLSERRAMAVKKWLMKRGVPEEHIKTLGRGESEPARGNETEVMRRENRRVVVSITQ